MFKSFFKSKSKSTIKPKLSLTNKPVGALEGLEQDIRYRDRLIGGLVFALVVIGIGVLRIPTQLTIYHPPDLSKGEVTRLGDIPPTTVYAFAVLFIERLMYCEKDCDVDYKQTLERNRAFITEQCYTQLTSHYENNRQLYKNRTRKLIPLDSSVFDYKKVNQLAENRWVVTETFEFDERIRGEALRSFNMKYPLQIIKKNMSTTLNPYQMQLDCFAGDPERVQSRTNLGDKK